MSQLLIPGFANVHSHAFQRGLRGTVQRRDPNRSDTFWTWRETMYALANKLDLQRIEDWARLTYIECLEAGYTAIGEFHYLHHRPDGAAWENPIASSEAILRAARQAGIRINLLWTVYARGGFDRDLTPNQRRFGATSITEIWRSIDRVMDLGQHPKRQIGLALHSVRAVPREWLGPLAEGARERGLKIHAHVSEQPLEVSDCRAHTGLSPIGLLDQEGVLGPDFTAIHATWLDDDDVKRLSDSGSHVGLCPTTEGDLGDGVPRTEDLLHAQVPLSIGSDSHAVIDPFSELRLISYQARARANARCVLADKNGEVNPTLRNIGHHNGYLSLGLPSDGDTIEIDAHSRLLERCNQPEEALWLAGHPGIIDHVSVAGERLVEHGRHIAT